MRSLSGSGAPASSNWCASSERNENLYEALATYPARCAASCVESLNSSVLRSSGASAISWPPVNSWVTVAEASAASAVPRNLMPLSALHAGQVSSLAAWSAVFLSRMARANQASCSPSPSSATGMR